MANTASAKKATRRIARRTLVNNARRSRVKTHIRKTLDAIQNGNLQLARKNLQTTESEIMRAVAKGVLHRNTAARKISRLAKRLNNAVANTAA